MAKANARATPEGVNATPTPSHADSPAWRKDATTQAYLDSCRDAKVGEPLNATYAAMVTRLDRNIGRLVETLKRLDLTRKTLIVFTSDHGATFESGNQGTSAALDSNRPFRGQKRTLWEGGIRVPAVVSWPGTVPERVIAQEVVHLTDLLPTFVSAGGGHVDPAWRVDGINQLAVWTGKAEATERTLFWEWQSEGSNQLAALRGQFKIVVTQGGKPELFDVVADPADGRFGTVGGDAPAGRPRRDRDARHPCREHPLPLRRRRPGRGADADPHLAQGGDLAV